MANPEHLKILKQGVKAWNEWRYERLNFPDLSGADLNGVDLSRGDLHGADFSGASLINAELMFANLNSATLISTDLRDADLREASFSYARLSGADITGALLGFTTFVGNDLSEVRGLETVIHAAQSSISIDTLYKSAGKIPERFLRGCGVPDDFIAFIPSHFGVQQAIQFYS